MFKFGVTPLKDITNTYLCRREEHGLKAGTLKDITNTYLCRLG